MSVIAYLQAQGDIDFHLWEAQVRASCEACAIYMCPWHGAGAS